MTSQDTSLAALPVLVLDAGPLPGALKAMAAAATPPLRLAAVSEIPASADFAVVTVVTGAVTTLAQALADGQDPDESLARWQVEATDWLRLLRGNRGQVAVVERGALRAAPDLCAQALQARLPLGQPEPAAEAAPTDPTAGFIVLAQAWVAGDSAAQALDDELQAMTHGAAAAGADRRAGLQDLAAALRAAQTAIPETEVATESETETETETEHLLLEDIAGLQAELERMTLELRVQEQATRAVDARAQTRLEAARHREGLIGAALVQDGATQTQLRTTQAQLTAELEQLRAELARTQAEAQAQLSEVYASTSWKLTAPVRAVRRGLGGA